MIRCVSAECIEIFFQEIKIFRIYKFLESCIAEPTSREREIPINNKQIIYIPKIKDQKKNIVEIPAHIS